MDDAADEGQRQALAHLVLKVHAAHDLVNLFFHLFRGHSYPCLRNFPPKLTARCIWSLSENRLAPRWHEFLCRARRIGKERVLTAKYAKNRENKNERSTTAHSESSPCLLIRGKALAFRPSVFFPELWLPGILNSVS
jgi:hypothetical protein